MADQIEITVAVRPKTRGIKVRWDYNNDVLYDYTPIRAGQYSSFFVSYKYNPARLTIKYDDEDKVIYDGNWDTRKPVVVMEDYTVKVGSGDRSKPWSIIGP